MPALTCDLLKAWRHGHGWSADQMARRLHRAGKDRGLDVRPLDTLRRYVYRWENRDDSRLPDEGHQLLYMLTLGLRSLDELLAGPPDPGVRIVTDLSGQEEDDPVRRRTFVALTGISAVDAASAENAVRAVDLRLSRAVQEPS